MNTALLKDAVSATTYPGRGIILGTNDAGKAVAAYFIMGRSVNSRNRIFMPQGDGLRTEAFDPAKLSDPSLVIAGRKVGFANHSATFINDTCNHRASAINCAGIKAHVILLSCPHSNAVVATVCKAGSFLCYANSGIIRIICMKRIYLIHKPLRTFSRECPGITAIPLAITMPLVAWVIFKITILHEFRIQSSVSRIIDIFKENTHQHIADLLRFICLYAKSESPRLEATEAVCIVSQAFSIFLSLCSSHLHSIKHSLEHRPLHAMYVSDLLSTDRKHHTHPLW